MFQESLNDRGLAVIMVTKELLLCYLSCIRDIVFLFIVLSEILQSIIVTLLQS